MEASIRTEAQAWKQTDRAGLGEFLDALVESYGQFGLKTGKQIQLQTEEAEFGPVVMGKGWCGLLRKLLLKLSYDIECDKIVYNCVENGLNIHFANWKGDSKRAFQDKVVLRNMMFLEDTYAYGNFKWDVAAYRLKSNHLKTNHSDISEQTLVFKLRFS